jgi:hypothetical protein
MKPTTAVQSSAIRLSPVIVVSATRKNAAFAAIASRPKTAT